MGKVEPKKTLSKPPPSYPPPHPKKSSLKWLQRQNSYSNKFNCKIYIFLSLHASAPLIIMKYPSSQGMCIVPNMFSNGCGDPNYNETSLIFELDQAMGKWTHVFLNQSFIFNSRIFRIQGLSPFIRDHYVRFLRLPPRIYPLFHYYMGHSKILPLPPRKYPLFYNYYATLPESTPPSQNTPPPFLQLCATLTESSTSFQNIALFHKYMRHSQNVPLPPRIYPLFNIYVQPPPPRIYRSLSEYTLLSTTSCEVPRIYPSLPEYTPLFQNCIARSQKLLIPPKIYTPPPPTPESTPLHIPPPTPESTPLHISPPLRPRIYPVTYYRCLKGGYILRDRGRFWVSVVYTLIRLPTHLENLEFCPKKPCMEKSWNLKKDISMEKSWNFVSIICIFFQYQTTFCRIYSLSLVFFS